MSRASVIERRRVEPFAGTPGASRRTALAETGVALVIAASAALFHLRFVAGSYFTQDDYYNFSLAAERGLSVRYLAEPVFQHLLPGARLANWLLQTFAPVNWGVAVASLLIALAASVLLLQHVLTLLVGHVWWRFLLTAGFAFSISHTRDIEWWSGALVGIPATLTGLAAIASWLQWRRSGRVWWLLLSVAMVMVGIGFIVKLVFVPFVLIGMRLFVLDRAGGVRSSARLLWRERWQWLTMTLPPIGFVVLAVSRGYYRTGSEIAGPAALIEFLARAWGTGFVPSLMGVALPSLNNAAGVFVVVSGQILFAALVAFTVLRQSAAWRSWAVFALTFFVLLLIVGVSRVAIFGQEVSQELRYFPEVTYLFPIFLALALRPGAQLGTPPDVAAAPVLPTRSLLSVALALSLAQLAVASAGARDLTSGWIGFQARDYVTTVRGDIEALDDVGQLPVLLDSPVPAEVIAPWLTPYHLQSRVLTTFEPGLEFDRMDDDLAVVRGDGSLARAVLTPSVDLLAADQLTVGGVPVTGRPGCVTAQREPVYIEYRPAAPLRGSRLALAASYNEQQLPPPVFVDRGTGYPGANDVALRVDGSTVSIVGPALVAARIDVPPGQTLCLRELTVVEVSEGPPLVSR